MSKTYWHFHIENIIINITGRLIQTEVIYILYACINVHVCLFRSCDIHVLQLIWPTDEKKMEPYALREIIP